MSTKEANWDSDKGCAESIYQFGGFIDVMLMPTSGIVQTPRACIIVTADCLHLV